MAINYFTDLNQSGMNAVFFCFIHTAMSFFGDGRPAKA